MFDLYQENILDHAHAPRHWGLLAQPDLHGADDNPLCGDRLEVTLRVDADNCITAVGWAGHGCAISQAAASMLGEQLIGKPLSVVKALTREDIFTLIGIPLSMNRVKCALLSLKVVKAAVYGLHQDED